MFPLGSIAGEFRLKSSRVIQMNKKWISLALAGFLLGGCQNKPKEPELTRYSNMALGCRIRYGDDLNRIYGNGRQVQSVFR